MLKQFIVSCTVFTLLFFSYSFAEETFEDDDYSNYPFHEEIAEPISDPLEPLNRLIYGFNRAFESIITIPVTTVYKAIIPKPVRTGVGNFMQNFKEPVHFINGILTLQPKRSVDALSRFVVNSSVGVLGFIDVAGASKSVPETYDLTFTNTFKKYGAKRGAYLVLPILGSSDIRNVFGQTADYFSNPLTYAFHKDFMYVKGGVSYIHYKNEYMGVENHIRKDALDEYLSYRSYYEQYHNEDEKN